jgi:hypothetical protein
MPLRMLELPAMFRPGTSITYPPFKKGRYMEEYVYEYLTAHQESIDTDSIYIPVFWTNLQNHPGFRKQKDGLTILLQKALQQLPPNALLFTVVQHDDGPFLPLPKQTVLFGACTGDIPLPLLYEDTTDHLLTQPRPVERSHLASFVGTLTHLVRQQMVQHLENKPNIQLLTKPHAEWTNQVAAPQADRFVATTLASKFCLAPRGYGRSSFRFFEAMLLDTVPVYLWDDKEWLPYKEVVDYSTFAISVQEKDIPGLYQRLESISDETYQQMVTNLQKHRHLFTLEFMCEYIVMKITRKA